MFYFYQYFFLFVLQIFSLQYLGLLKHLILLIISSHQHRFTKTDLTLSHLFYLVIILLHSTECLPIFIKRLPTFIKHLPTSIEHLATSIEYLFCRIISQLLLFLPINYTILLHRLLQNLLLLLIRNSQPIPNLLEELFIFFTEFLVRVLNQTHKTALFDPFILLMFVELLLKTEIYLVFQDLHIVLQK